MGILNRLMLLFTGFNWLIIPAALLAIIFHELSHGFVSFLLGDRTAKEHGRLSLNPFKHMDILGLICMVIFGFGWAKPVPINSYFFKNKKLGITLVSFAGPLSNIVLATLAVFFGVLLSGIPEANEIFEYLLVLISYFLAYFSILNVGLAVFNLLPIPPLDGSKVLFALLPEKAYRFILNYERYGILILIVLINLPFFSDILVWLRQLLYSGIENLVYTILIR